MSVKCTTCDKSCSFRKEPFHSDYATLLARHNALKDAAKGLLAIHKRHKGLVVYSEQDYIDIWRERVDALAALVGEE